MTAKELKFSTITEVMDAEGLAIESQLEQPGQFIGHPSCPGGGHWWEW